MLPPLAGAVQLAVKPELVTLEAWAVPGLSGAWVARLASGVSLAVLVATPAWAQDAADAGAADDAASNEIVVTGFRQSLQAALNVKRDSVAAVDAIVAEDIAKFPDQNLAESLQRIPGISIQQIAMFLRMNIMYLPRKHPFSVTIQIEEA